MQEDELIPKYLIDAISMSRKLDFPTRLKGLIRRSVPFLLTGCLSVLAGWFLCGSH